MFFLPEYSGYHHNVSQQIQWLIHVWKVDCEQKGNLDMSGEQ